MWLTICLTLITQVEQLAPPQSPADAVLMAHADLRRLPPDRQKYARYLSLYNLPLGERAKWIQTLSGHVNGLSRESDTTPVYIIPDTLGAIVRVYLDDYRWDVKLWDTLVDPYFTVSVETETLGPIVPWPGGMYSDGKSYPANSFTTQAKVKTKTVALAPWLSETDEQRKKLADLVLWTGSKVPVVRADWFHNQTAAAVDRKPNYYDFLGIKDEKTFQTLIGFDAKKERRKVELREAIADSGVTLQPRAIVRETAEDGGYWKSLDFKKAVDRKNPLKILGRDVEEAFDASEQYGLLPNGLWATFLGDKGGKRQDSAPDSIASDGASKSNDRRVHVNVSCIRCHANGGLQSLDGYVRNLSTPPLDLKANDYAKVRELRAQYGRKIEPFIAKDRAAYEDAIKEATTGLSSKEYAASYGEFWERYEDAKIDLNRAAAELGTTSAKLRAVIVARLKANQGDTVLSVLILENPRVNRITVRQWEEAFESAMLTVRGYR